MRSALQLQRSGVQTELCVMGVRSSFGVKFICVLAAPIAVRWKRLANRSYLQLARFCQFAGVCAGACAAPDAYAGVLPYGASAKAIAGGAPILAE